jgi:hypothetical protein
MALTKVVDAMTSGVSVVGHTHAISDVSTLQTSLDGKSATGHTHVIADVTDAAGLVLTTYSVQSAVLNATAAGVLIAASNHNLGVQPSVVRAVFVCSAADLNYSIGDEVDLCNVSTNNSPFNNYGVSWSSTTQVGFISSVASSTIRLPNKTTFALTAIANSSWAVKVYAKK